jgi:hypothetical protein
LACSNLLDFDIEIPHESDKGASEGSGAGGTDKKSESDTPKASDVAGSLGQLQKAASRVHNRSGRGIRCMSSRQFFLKALGPVLGYERAKSAAGEDWDQVMDVFAGGARASVQACSKQEDYMISLDSYFILSTLYDVIVIMDHSVDPEALTQALFGV